MKQRVMATLASVLVSALPLGVAETKFTSPQTTIWLGAPAKGFRESSPLGNGGLGAMMFGGVDEERIVLNESSVWSGSRQDTDRPGASKVLPEIRRLQIEGKNGEAETLQILQDKRLDTVEGMALNLLKGFNAGTSYGEIWIRDFNTFINGSLRVHPKEEVKERLLLFFKVQGEDGNIPDGVIKSEQANVGYKYTHSELAPGWAAHKNTVETDQESSLIQAVRKYVDATGDRSILSEEIGGRSVLKRMEAALKYVLKERWSEKYGLVIGATTVDWGDMQAQSGWGVAINDKTKWAIDIYDNAMFLMALNDFLAMVPEDFKADINWKKQAAALKKNVRQHLWDAKASKYIPHIYLNGSPFPADFNERQILYTGGTACAILAGLHDKSEILEINRQFLAAAAKEKHATIGITVYPPYPLEAFPNVPPYTYQNGGDWTWFGGRMIQALVANGLVEQAYAELNPMIERVLKNKGFFEWYDVKTANRKGPAISGVRLVSYTMSFGNCERGRTTGIDAAAATVRLNVHAVQIIVHSLRAVFYENLSAMTTSHYRKD